MCIRDRDVNEDEQEAEVAGRTTDDDDYVVDCPTLNEIVVALGKRKRNKPPDNLPTE